jgi:predicted small integral membrane protein
MVIERYLAAILVAGVGLNELFHGLDGLQNFSTNASDLGPVMSMTTPGQAETWRAVDSPLAALIVYALVVAAHSASGVISLVGSYFLATNAGHGAREHSSQTWVAILGVGIGCTLYLVGFIAIASGFFQMYLSQTNNFGPHAERSFLVYMAVLIYLQMVPSRGKDEQS